MPASATSQPEPWQPGQAGYRRLLWGLFLAGVATFAQLYAPQGLLPAVAADLDVTADQAALLVSAATAGLAVAVLPWAAASDRFGRRRIMAVSVLSACAFALASGLAPSIEVALVLRFFEGAAHAGVAALAVTFIVEEVSGVVAAAATGAYIAGTTLGGLSGRLVAAPVGELLGWRVGLLSVTGLGVLCAVGFLLITPRARRFRPSSPRPRAVLAAVAAHLRTPQLLALYAVAALLMGGFVALYNYVGFAATSAPLHWPLGVVALLFLAYLAGTWSSPWAGRQAARFGRFRVLILAMLVMAAGALLTAVLHPLTLILGLLVFTGAFFAAHAIAASWASTAAEHARAHSSSLYTLGYYGGSSVFGWLAGVVYVSAGWTATAAGVAGLAVAALGISALALRRTGPSPT
ncbi:MAG: MFS transporter [Micrococcus sp.]|nr:MFS transporter [Micrococcus sp.]